MKGGCATAAAAANVAANVAADNIQYSKFSLNSKEFSFPFP